MKSEQSIKMNYYIQLFVKILIRLGSKEIHIGYACALLGRCDILNDKVEGEQ